MRIALKKNLLGVATVVLSSGVVVIAQAQNAPPPTASAAPGAASTAPATSAAPGSAAPAAASSGPTIATPAPDAPPAKVEKAKQVAKAAELTPIVPNPKDATRPAFQLYAELDLPVLGIGIVFAAARLVKTQKAFCAPQCDPADLNALDRTTAGYYSTAWGTASDIGLYAAVAGAAVVLVADEGFADALNDSVVIAESALSATAVASMMTLAAGRPRPFLYGTNAPLDLRNGSDAALSFLSSHTAVTSAIGSSLFMTLHRLHPDSSGPYWVLAAGGALAAFVGTARVMGGNHFITDAAGGFVVGTSMGFLIPALHQSPVKIVPVVNDTQKGVGVGGVF